MNNIKVRGFTIVELIIVIVVIGILAALSAVSYTGVKSNAIVVTLQSDLANASDEIKIFRALSPKNDYPTAVVCPSPGATEICLKNTGSNTPFFYTYNNSNPKVFNIISSNGKTAYRADQDTPPTPSAVLACPAGYIAVPGSATYRTSDFCVMKYEAKNSGGVAVSVPAGAPWIGINQTTAMTTAAAACAGCHLITEAEWLTIAQNISTVPSNWVSGVVGTGTMYRGHSDGSVIIPSMLAADTVGENGYIGTGNSSPSEQRRTLTLTTGAIIWDLAGNVVEWTSAQIAGNQPGPANGYDWREWTTMTVPGLLAVDPYPSGNGIAGSSAWTSANGVGKIYSNANELTLRGFRRGSNYHGGTIAGVYSLFIDLDPGNNFFNQGFRVTKP